MIKWLRCILEDNVGNPSSMRVLVAFVVVVQVLGWASVVWRTGTLPVMDWQTVGTILGALGMKAWQKGKE